MKKINSFVLITLLLVISSSFSILNHKDEWKFKKKKNGISLYTSTTKGSNYRGSKVVLDVPGDFEDIMNIVNDLSNVNNWFHGCLKSKIITRTKDKQIAYVEIDLPFPYDNRYFIYVTEIIERTDKTIKIKMYDLPEHDYIKEKNGLVKITSVVGYAEYTQVEGGSVRIINTNSMDPGGNLPAWVANMFLVDGSLHSYTNLQEYLKTGEDSNELPNKN
jgi:hypothetical protein